METLVHYPVMPHLAPPTPSKDLPAAPSRSPSASPTPALSLPLYPQLPDSGRDLVVAALREAAPAAPHGG